jgi:hypothetical protein
MASSSSLHTSNGCEQWRFPEAQFTAPSPPQRLCAAEAAIHAAHFVHVDGMVLGSLPHLLPTGTTGAAADKPTSEFVFGQRVRAGVVFVPTGGVTVQAAGVFVAV